MHQKPFAESCVENRTPILAALQPRVASCQTLLEIGSGTGQHAVYFAPHLTHLTWQTSDRRDQHPGIRSWLDEAALENVLAPLALDVLLDPWPPGPFDAVFSANTAHIMSEAAVEAMFRGVGAVLIADGRFLLYGPFMYDGRQTAPSNADFDRWLRHRDGGMGVRDVSWLKEVAEASGLSLDEDLEMPVNNRILVWRKVA